MLQALATPLFAYSVGRYVSVAQWEAHLDDVAGAAAGFLCVVASWTGRYGWPYESFWTYPPTYVRFIGFVLLAVVALFGFR